MRIRRKWACLLPVILAAVVLVNSIADGFLVDARAESSSEIQLQIERLESESQDIQNRIEELETQQSHNSSEIADVLAQKDSIDQQIALLFMQISNLNDQISAYRCLIADKQDELNVAQERLNALNEQHKLRLRAMEEEGKLTFWSVLFQANSFSDLLDRLSMMEEIAAADRRRLQEIQDAAEVVKQAKAVLVQEKDSLELVLEKLNAAQTELNEKSAEADALLADLVARGVEYQKLLEDRESELDALMQEIAKQEHAYNEAKQREYEQWLSTSVPPVEDDTPETSDDPNDDTDTEDEEGDEPSKPEASGAWLVPCDYVYVSSLFNPGRLHPILGYVRPHNGIDLAAYTGTPVIATRSGTVSIADHDEEAGEYVFINHGDGFSSGYLHLRNYIVSSGQYVEAGEVIGYVGSTGLSEGPHLHFAISFNGTYVNPADYIDF